MYRGTPVPESSSGNGRGHRRVRNIGIAAIVASIGGMGLAYAPWASATPASISDTIARTVSAQGDVSGTCDNTGSTITFGNNTVNFDDYVLIDLAFNTQSDVLGRQGRQALRR